MKIFGFKFGKDAKKSSNPGDLIPEIKDISISNDTDDDIVPTGTKSPTVIGKVQSPVYMYSQYGYSDNIKRRRGVFEPAEYDLYEIGRIEDVDSYVRQGFKKKIGLCLKEGFDYIGKNKKTVKYIRTRFAQLARATGIPHEELVRRLISSFIKKSNAYLVKVRDEKKSGGKVRVDQNGKKLKPIAGYFIAPAETMEMQCDESGKPLTWRQKMPSGFYVEFPADDVVQFTFDRKEGFLYGTPILTPVVDDIRALRKIEENIELLIYKHIFPIFQYIVGTENKPAGVNEHGEREIDVVKREIQYMPTEGGIVTPERHEIKAIGAEGKALRAEAYLEHFKKRVFSGMGMSSVDFGEADTSNRSTADNLSRSLTDDVKDFQDSFEAQFNEYVINELLLESTFTEDVLAEENIVRLYFREIDIDKQIKVENHAVDSFTKNAITWDEMRAEFGHDPVRIPVDATEGADKAAFPEWNRTAWKLFEEPKAIISAGDEAYSPYTAAASENPNIDLTPEQLAAQQEGQTEAEIKKIKAKPVPKPTVKKKDNFLTEEYRNMRETVAEESGAGTNKEWIHQQMMFFQERMVSKLKAQMNASLLKGLGRYNSNITYKVSSLRTRMYDHAETVIKRLTKDLERALKARIDSGSSDDRISNARTVFDAFEYRIDFITRTEIDRAYNLGKALNLYGNGITEGMIIVDSTACDDCKAMAHNVVDLADRSLDAVPPFHPNCHCTIKRMTAKE